MLYLPISFVFLKDANRNFDIGYIGSMKIKIILIRFFQIKNDSYREYSWPGSGVCGQGETLIERLFRQKVIKPSVPEHQ